MRSRSLVLVAVLAAVAAGAILAMGIIGMGHGQSRTDAGVYVREHPGGRAHVIVNGTT